MTFERDPPRLRTLERELPRDLAAALQETPEENATPADLARLAWRLRTRAKPELVADSLRRAGARRRGRGPIAAVVLTFALGAAAGVAGSSGVFFVMRETSVEPRAASSLTPSAAPRTMLARPSPPAPAPTEVTREPVSSLEAPPLRTSREPSPPVPPSVAGDPPVPVASSPAAGDRDELTLLARAQSALASNPAAALELALEHEGRFARGGLAQEREVVAIDALLRLGRRSEAVGRALRFNEQFPGSMHGRRIDVLLGRNDHK